MPRLQDINSVGRTVTDEDNLFMVGGLTIALPITFYLHNRRCRQWGYKLNLSYFIMGGSTSNKECFITWHGTFVILHVSVIQKWRWVFLVCVLCTFMVQLQLRLTQLLRLRGPLRERLLALYLE